MKIIFLTYLFFKFILTKFTSWLPRSLTECNFWNYSLNFVNLFYSYHLRYDYLLKNQLHSFYFKIFILLINTYSCPASYLIFFLIYNICTYDNVCTYDTYFKKITYNFVLYFLNSNLWTLFLRKPCPEYYFRLYIRNFFVTNVFKILSTSANFHKKYVDKNPIDYDAYILLAV